MKTLISLLSVFAALSGFSQVYTTPEVVTNIARGEAFSILGSITNGGGGTTNIIIVTNVLPSNLITQYYNGAYLTGTFSGVFRGNGAALSNVQPASANLTNWSMLSTSVLATAGSTKFNNSQFTTNGNTVSFRANAPVTNLFNFGTLNMSSLAAPETLPYFLWDSDANYALTMDFRHYNSSGAGMIVKADPTNFKWDFSNLTEPYESWINFNHVGAQFSFPPSVTAFVVSSQLGLGPIAVSDYQLASIAYVKDSTRSHRSYPSNVVDTAVPLTNGILANRGGTNFWTLDGSSLTNIQVEITNIANIVTQNMTGTMLSGTFSSGGTYPIWLTNTSNEGYLMGLGSDSSTNIALRWDSSNNRLLAPAVSATGIFIGDGSSVTNVTTDVRLVENAVSLFSPSVKAAFKQPPVVTPNIRNPYTNALMGWFSWNNNQCPDQWYWTNMIGKMVSLGLRDAGYTAVCFDAPWQEGRDVNGYPLWNTNRFPDGIAYCSAYARSNGLKFFMWTPASQYTNNIVYANCTTNWQGAGGYAAQDAHFMATNFVEGVVLDNFWSSGFDTNLQAFVAAMETHVATNGRPVYYKTIGYGSWFPPFATNMHAMRVATDITTNWSDIAKQFNAWEDAADHVGPGGCLPDMDMLEIGNGLVSPDADVAHFSIWAVSGTPLMLGMNLTNMATYVRQTITNANLIRIHQDPGQYPGRIVKRTRVPGGTQDIWLKPLGWPGSGTNVVLLVNNSTNTGYIPFRMSELGLGTNNWVRCITPFAEQDHGIVPDYFRYKNFVTAYQSRCYLIVSDPNSNNVVGTFKDYIVNGGDNVTLSGTFAGSGLSLTNLNSTNAFPSIQFYKIGDTNFIGTGGFFPFYWDRNLQIVYAAPAGNGLVANKFIAAGVGASFIGDGSGLTNISSSIPSDIVTNNQQNASLGGVFTGDGAGLTGIQSAYSLVDPTASGSVVFVPETQTWLGDYSGTFTGDAGLLTNISPSSITGKLTSAQMPQSVMAPQNGVLKEWSFLGSSPSGWGGSNFTATASGWVATNIFATAEAPGDWHISPVELRIRFTLSSTNSGRFGISATSHLGTNQFKDMAVGINTVNNTLELCTNWIEHSIAPVVLVAKAIPFTLVTNEVYTLTVSELWSYRRRLRLTGQGGVSVELEYGPTSNIMGIPLCTLGAWSASGGWTLQEFAILADTSPDLLIAGDSNTYYSGAGSWPNTLETSLSQARMVVSGISGANSTTALADQALLSAITPKTALLVIGSNDSSTNTWITNVETWLANYAQAGARTLLGTVFPRATTNANAIFQRDYARAKGTNCVDFWRVLATNDTTLREEFNADGLHINAAGKIEVAGYVWNTLPNSVGAANSAWRSLNALRLAATYGSVSGLVVGNRVIGTNSLYSGAVNNVMDVYGNAQFNNTLYTKGSVWVDGSVGVGITAPAYPVHVSKSQAIVALTTTATTNTAHIRLQSSSIGYVGIEGSAGGKFYTNSTANYVTVGHVAGYGVQLGAGGMIQARLYPSGNWETQGTSSASNYAATATGSAPSYRAAGTNNMVLMCPDGGSYILRVANDGTLTTVTNTGGL